MSWGQLISLITGKKVRRAFLRDGFWGQVVKMGLVLQEGFTI